MCELLIQYIWFKRITVVKIYANFLWSLKQQISVLFSKQQLCEETVHLLKLTNEAKLKITTMNYVNRQEPKRADLFRFTGACKAELQLFVGIQKRKNLMKKSFFNWKLFEFNFPRFLIHHELIFCSMNLLFHIGFEFCYKVCFDNVKSSAEILFVRRFKISKWFIQIKKNFTDFCKSDRKVFPNKCSPLKALKRRTDVKTP